MAERMDVLNLGRGLGGGTGRGDVGVFGDNGVVGSCSEVGGGLIKLTSPHVLRFEHNNLNKILKKKSNQLNH